MWAYLAEGNAQRSNSNLAKRKMLAEDLRTLCGWDLVLCENVIPLTLAHMPDVACGHAELLYLYFSLLPSISEAVEMGLACGEFYAFFPKVRVTCRHKQKMRRLRNMKRLSLMFED